MPYKSDDFQDLFQKAGSDYPLRTDNSDWDNVAAKLNAAANEPKATNTRFLKYAFIFLLLLSGSVVFYKVQFYTDKMASKEQGAKQHINSNAVAGKATELNINKNLASKDINFHKDQNELPVSTNWNEIKVVANSSRQTVSVIKNDINSNVPLNINEIIISSSKFIKPDNPTSSIISDKKISGNVDDRTSVSSTINPDNVQPTRQPVKFRRPPSKFYGTFYGSPEFSTVKFQKIDEPGYKLGIALGYSINERFDVEIGLQRERINFYSDGKYFDRNALPIKSDDAVLDNVNGRSKITSVPVTLKYNFASKKIGHFYTAAGINVVQITHTEVYDYIVSKNGTERDHSKKYSSVSDPKYLTGIIASAGYEVKVCNWVNMKAEPYYQIPIQSFGLGRLPVTSFGINVGIVKRFK